MRWISSDGGPLILIDRNYVAEWRGVTALVATDDEARLATTDYERACRVDKYVGLLRVGEGHGLVLGDEPMQTTWIPRSDFAGMIVRWRYAPDKQTAEKYARCVPDSEFEPADLVFQMRGQMILFDSACDGRTLSIDEALTIDVANGTYVIETAIYTPDTDTSLVIHKVTRATHSTALS